MPLASAAVPSPACDWRGSAPMSRGAGDRDGASPRWRGRRVGEHLNLRAEPRCCCLPAAGRGPLSRPWTANVTALAAATAAVHSVGASERSKERVSPCGHGIRKRNKNWSTEGVKSPISPVINARRWLPDCQIDAPSFYHGNPSSGSPIPIPIPMKGGSCRRMAHPRSPARGSGCRALRALAGPSGGQCPESMAQRHGTGGPWQGAKHRDWASQPNQPNPPQNS